MNLTSNLQRLIQSMVRNFNFGGWAHIRNANIVTADESRIRTVL